MSRFFESKGRYALVGLAVVVGGLLMMASCNDAPRAPTRRSSGRSVAARQDNSAALIETVAKTLNYLPAEVVLDLLPPEPILDDSKSADGQPVLASLDLNPQDPEGGYVYLSVPAGNGNFSGLRVQAGDIVRYFVKYDEESEEHGGGGQVGFFEIPVRRLDTSNPNNALILEVPLTAPVPPHRIEIWRFSDRRVREIRLLLEKYVRRRDPAIAWEPSPDESALVQLVERVNQWFRNLGKDRIDWKAPSITDSLPADVRGAKSIATLISPDSLRKGQFNLAEARSMQEAIWHRDISTWAKGDAYEKVDVAEALFDWTIRNIQLDDSSLPRIVHQPWQALMYGHGSAKDRAWVFAELCRQQQIDVVILGFGGAGEETTPEKWLVAVVADDTLSLFDPQLGLPIPGTEPNTVATLAEVIADPELLRKLDLDTEQTYPITAEDLKTIRSHVVATPLQLSRRAALLQDVLQGEDFVVLTADVERIEKALKSHEEISAVELWAFPYESRLAEETMKRPQRDAAAQRFLVFSQSPRLWKARVLHFQGTKPVPVSQQNDPLAQPRRGHRDATQLYQSSEIRPSDDLLDRLAPLERAFLTTAKMDASYWLGLLSYDLGKFQVADDWFRTRTLEAFPNGPWKNGARYNLARTLIELDKKDEAIAILEADDSPQRYGNRLLAKQLQSSADPDATAEE